MDIIAFIQQPSVESDKMKVTWQCCHLKIPNDENSIEDESILVEVESNEPRNYVAGYICKKLNLLPSDTENLSSWVSVKGEGKLVEPSPNLISMVAKCDDLFDVFHGKGIKVGKNPLEKVSSFILAEHPDFPPKIVNLFCKVKFFSRLKALNNNIKLSRVKTVRNLKQIGQFTN
jgi:hypothetical protein